MKTQSAIFVLFLIINSSFCAIMTSTKKTLSLDAKATQPVQTNLVQVKSQNKIKAMINQNSADATVAPTNTEAPAENKETTVEATRTTETVGTPTTTTTTESTPEATTTRTTTTETTPEGDQHTTTTEVRTANDLDNSEPGSGAFVKYSIVAMTVLFGLF